MGQNEFGTKSMGQSVRGQKLGDEMSGYPVWIESNCEYLNDAEHWLIKIIKLILNTTTTRSACRKKQ